jgi:sugar phosphate permease
MPETSSLQPNRYAKDNDNNIQCEKASLDGREDATIEFAQATGRHSPTLEEKKLVRKLDWVILPVLWIMYWFNYLDRNAITVARLDGLEKELNLSSTEYQTCVSILFVGYILGQIPSSRCSL